MSDEEIIRQAAHLLVGKWSETAEVAIAATMLECAAWTPNSGRGAKYENWLPALQSLGEIILALAKREGRHTTR